MRVGRTITAVAAILLALVTPVAVASTASAASINFGACSANIEPWQHPYVAPGRSGNGPLTGETGNLHIPAAFSGGMGCVR